MKKSPIIPTLALAALFLIRHSSLILAQGPITPPGAPAATMKTLQQVEPRTPISSVPFTINSAGSYYLTSNLTQSGSAAGIIISADNVTVDLGGFVLLGTLAGTAAGISVPAARKNLQVRNGTIRNWNGGGIAASNATNSVFSDLRLSDNFDTGLSAGAGALVVDCVADTNIIGLNVGAGSTIRSCTVSNNLGDGLGTGDGCTITGCTARGNNGHGILAAAGCTVVACTANANIAGDGIQAGEGSLVKDRVSTGNSGDGIQVTGNQAIVENCSAGKNGGVGILSAIGSSFTVIRKCSAYDNVLDGIKVNSVCQIIDNVAASNGTGVPDTAGINVTDSRNRIEGNTVTFNDTGIRIIGINNLVFRNTAASNTKQFDIFSNNKVGVIVAPPNSAVINGATGGAGLGTTDPWANFSY